ncbi:MAG: oligosaccharide flippase family protein [Pseudomonadales bacterium]|jgi:O-antigen/teichoic acid export membrane protein|nr:oligosaccharide flippase family protein [Pseudomonadales bacterium]
MAKITPKSLAQEQIEVDQAEIKKKTVSGAMSFFARTVFLNSLALITNFILGMLLTLADFGVYGVVVQIIGILTFFSDVGLASALIQSKKEPTDKDYQTIFWVQMSLAVLIVIASFVIVQTGLFSEQFGEHGRYILFALSFSFLFAALRTVPSIKLTRQLNFTKLIWPPIVEQVAFNGVLIFLVVAGYGVASYAYAIWARSLSGTAVLFLIMPYLPKLNFSWQSFKNNIKFGAKFQLNDFLARVKDQFFFLTVSQFVNIYEFGLISFSKSWSMFPYNLTVQNVLAITFPTFSRLQEHKDLLKRALEKSIFFITLAIFPILMGMIMMFWPVTQVIPRYIQWEPATLTFILFTLSIAPAAISTPMTNILNATGHLNKTLKLMIMWTVLTWAISIPLIHFRGFEGVAIGAFLVSLTSFLPIIYVKKIVDFNLFDNIWRQIVASAVMVILGLIMMQFMASGLLYFVIGGMILAMAYAITMWLVGSTKLKAEFNSLGIIKRKI